MGLHIAAMNFQTRSSIPFVFKDSQIPEQIKFPLHSQEKGDILNNSYMELAEE